VRSDTVWPVRPARGVILGVKFFFGPSLRKHVGWTNTIAALRYYCMHCSKRVNESGYKYILKVFNPLLCLRLLWWAGALKGSISRC
jgi:hypothetical protein